MSERIPEALAKLVQDSITEMLTSVEVLSDFHASEVGPSSEVPSSADVAAVLGYTGDQINGSLVVACPKGVLDASHPNHAMGMPVSDNDISDWAGEIANQSLGRIKNRLASQGVKFAMSTPTSVTGKQMQIRPPKNGHALEMRFTGAKGMVLMHFLTVFDAALKFDAMKKEETAKEGDSLLF